MKSIFYFAILITCLVGVGYALSESEDTEGAITNPTNATLVDNIWYTVWDGEAIVRGPSSANLTTITIPSTVTIDGQTYTVTGIAGVLPDSSHPYQSTGAFSDMFSLTTVTLPYTLESFNAQYDANSANYTYSNAFAITYGPDAVNSKLTTVNWDIPEGETCHLTSIGPGVFQNCKKLATFDIPDSVTTISERAFESCNAYSISQFPSALTSIGNYSFISTAITVSTVPQTVTFIGENAFYNCKSIPSFTLPDTVTISPGVFGGCTSLQSIKFPAGLTAIPEYICSGCTSLTTVTMPTNYTSIGSSSFENCANINFTLPNNVTSIGASAFKGCTSLHTALPSSLTTLGNNAFQNCYAMEISTIPSGLTTIPQYAFQSAIGPNLTVPATVTSIGNNAFGLPRTNGQIATAVEITFEGDGAIGSSTNTVAMGNTLFTQSGVSFPEGMTITLNLYGNTYSNIRYSVPYGSSVVSVIFNNYSSTWIQSYSNFTINYYAVYGGIEYKLTNVQQSSSSSCNATVLGLTDDSITSIRLTNSFSYYYRTCNVTGIVGSATESGLGAFGGTGLTSVTINSLSINWYYNPNGSNFTYANTFKDCVNLTSVTLPTSGSIPAGMFYGCTNLDIANISTGITNINQNAFRDCSSLTLSNLDWSESYNLKLNSVGNHAFDGCVSLNPTALVFKSRSTVGDYAFAGCESLSNVQFGYNMTIGQYAFEGCELINADKFENVTIGDFAFNGCTSLNPSSFTNVSAGIGAFQNCTGLDSIVVQGTTALGPGVFNLADIEEPTTEERSLTLLFLTDDVDYNEYTFASGGPNSYERIYNIVDMGNNGFTTASSGLPASATVSDTLTVDAERMIQKIEVEGKEGGDGIGGVGSTLIKIVPIIVIASLLFAIMSMFFSPKGNEQ